MDSLLFLYQKVLETKMKTENDTRRGKKGLPVAMFDSLNLSAFSESGRGTFNLAGHD